MRVVMLTSRAQVFTTTMSRDDCFCTRTTGQGSSDKAERTVEKATRKRPGRAARNERIYAPYEARRDYVAK